MVAYNPEVWNTHPVRFNAVMLWAAACMCFFFIFEIGGGGSPVGVNVQSYRSSIGR